MAPQSPVAVLQQRVRRNVPFVDVGGLLVGGYGHGSQKCLLQ